MVQSMINFQFFSISSLSFTAFLSVIIIPAAFAAPDIITASQTLRPVKVIQLDIAKGDKVRLLPAEVFASEKATLSFRVAGEIAEILVRPGMNVKSGDVLAKLDSELYQQQFEVANAQFALAKVLFERASRLVDQGVVSRNDYDKAKSDYAIATASLDKATANLHYTQLVAPYDGVISKRFHRQFEFAQAQEPIIGIRTEKSVDVSFQLPEQFIGTIKNTSQASNQLVQMPVKFDSSDSWFMANLKELSTVADSTTSSYTIVLTLPMPASLNLLPGMGASVKVSIPELAEAANPMIPASAIVVEQGQQFVFRWLPDVNKVQKVPVSVIENRLMSGLVDGDWLVLAGASELKDGDGALRWIKEGGL